MKKITNTCLSLLIAAFFSTYATIAQQGSVDNSFNTADNGTYSQYIGGNPYYDYSPTSGILLPDNKSLVVYTSGETTTIKRINADGTIDNTFSFNDSANDAKIFLQPDGKFLVARDLSIKRYYADGSTDTSFNDPNIQNTNLPGLYGITNIKFLQDGKMYVYGLFTKVGTLNQKYIARLNADGSNDTTFNPGQSFDGGVADIEVMPDGRIIAVGNFTKYNNNFRKYFLRINADGSYDNTLTTLTTASGSYFYSSPEDIELLPNGKILVTGTEDMFTHSNTLRRGIIRLNSNFTYDTTFNASALFSSVSMQDGSITGILVQPDGKYIITTAAGNHKFIYRLETSGIKDASFTYNNTQGLNYTNVALRNDGKIMVYSTYKAANGVVRMNLHLINQDGSLDFTFNPQTGANNEVFQTVLLNDNKILMTGKFTAYNDNGAKYIVRINGDGTFDDTFALDESLTAEPFDSRLILKQQQDGKMLISTDKIKVNFINNYFIRLNTDGSVDTSFSTPMSTERPKAFDINTGGTILAAGTSDLYKNSSGKFKILKLNTDGSINTNYPEYGFDTAPISISIQQDGRVLVSGDFINYNNEAVAFLIRLNPDGTRDTSFNQGLLNIVRVTRTVTQADGKIIVSYDAANTHKIARLNSNGTIDTSFFINPGGTVVSGSDYHGFRNISVLPDGRILLQNLPIAQFNYISTSNTIALMLNADGTWDQSFVIQKPEIANDLVVQGCGKIIVGGKFTQIANAAKNNVARINITNNPNMPTGNTTQTFTPGQTLADLNVTGQDIQWYSDPSSCTVAAADNSVIDSDIALDENTLLEDGATYYASQTVGGLESYERLAVTVGSSLGTEDNNITNFKLYPNPATNNITIASQQNIDNVKAYSVYGQLILSRSYNEPTAIINIETLPDGIYIFTVTGGSRRQTFKVIKK
ncbi:MAG: T9SS type A sorting domain-containing protein [Flavobacterium sp.]